MRTKRVQETAQETRDVNVMPRNGEKEFRHDVRPSFEEPDCVAWERVARWELIGCIILLIVTVMMAAAVNFYTP